MKHLILFLLSVVAMATFVVATSHTGTLDGGVMPKEYYKQKYEFFERKNCQVVMCNGDTINYYAASKTRCDELYKYQHYIGVGKFLRTGELLHVYNPNHKIRFVTKQELEQHYGRPVFFTDVYDCN